MGRQGLGLSSDREPSLLEHKEMHVPGCDDELVYPSADRVFKAFTWNDTIVSLGVTRLERGIEDLVMCLSLAYLPETLATRLLRTK